MVWAGFQSFIGISGGYNKIRKIVVMLQETVRTNFLPTPTKCSIFKSHAFSWDRYAAIKKGFDWGYCSVDNSSIFSSGTGKTVHIVSQNVDKSLRVKFLREFMEKSKSDLMKIS